MDMKFKTTKEYKKIKRNFIKDIFLLSLIVFVVLLLFCCFLSLYIYFSILSLSGKNFPHFVLAIIISALSFVGFMIILFMYIKYILEFKAKFDVEKEKLNQYLQTEGVDKIE